MIVRLVLATLIAVSGLVHVHGSAVPAAGSDAAVADTTGTTAPDDGVVPAVADGSATGRLAGMDRAVAEAVAQDEAAPAGQDDVTVTDLPVVVPTQAQENLRALTGPARPAAGADAVVADQGAGDRVVTPVTETDGFQTVGMTWPGDADAARLDVQVRTRADDGTWSGWQQLEVADDAPDAGTADAASAEVRGGTDPLWVGEADAVQLSFPADGAPAPQDLELTLVDVPLPTTAEQGGAQASGALSTGGAVISNAALVVPTAMTTAPHIISRAQWGARPQVCTPGTASSIVGVVVHHTAGSNSYSTVAEAMQQIRGDQAYHIDGRGWCDIGYNFVVDKWGNIYEGRAGSLTKPVIGVHAGGFNTGTVGISMLGNYSTVTPPAATQEAVAQIAAWRLQQYHRDPAGWMSYYTYGGQNSSYPAGTTANLPVIFGHRDVAYTACPGQAGYSTLGAIRNRARSLVGAALVNPKATPSSATQGSGFTLRSATLSNIDWTLTVTSTRTGAVIARSIGYAQQALGGVVATWNGRDASSQPVELGAYAMTLTGVEHGTGVAVLPATVTVHVVPAQNPATVAQVPLASDLTFVPITPTRVLDTRPSGVPIRAASRIDLALAGHFGVPANAAAVAVNVTATEATAITHVRIWPSGRAMPGSSVLNADPTRSAAAAGVVVGVGGEGKVSLYNNAGRTHLVVDITGYYVASGGSAYRPLTTAARLYDTRAGDGRMTNGQRRTLTVAGRNGVPADATAVVVNVTSVVSSGDGYVSVVPSGSAAGATSTVNHLPHNDVANRATVPLAGGKVDVLLGGASADVVIDVVGWYGPGATARFTPIAPSRAVDTRVSGGALGQGGSRTIRLTGVPGDAVAAVTTLTATGQTAGATYLTVWPSGTARPGTSDLNTGRGRDQANSVVPRIGSGASVDVYNRMGSVQVLLDVYGYFR